MNPFLLASGTSVGPQFDGLIGGEDISGAVQGKLFPFLGIVFTVADDHICPCVGFAH